MQLSAFLGLSVVVICTPGPDTVLTVRNAVMGGWGGGAWTAGGVVSGQLLWTVATSLGLSSVLAASQPAFLALKLAGVAYLLYLGAQSLRAAWVGYARSVDDVRAPARLVRGQAYRQGLFNDLANPKIAAFFVPLLPQFVPTGSGQTAALAAFLGLGLLFGLLTFCWLLAYSVLIAKGRRLVERPRVRRILDAIAGCTLIGFGVRLAFAGQTR
jgi:threonine/homoserine/homoserine lactone efflux protein